MSRYHYHNHKRKRRDPLGIVLCLLLLAVAALIVVYALRNRSPKAPETTAAPALTEQTAPSADSGVPSQAPASTELQTAPPTTAAPQTAPSTEAPTTAPAQPEPTAEDWKLLLVNADHPLPEGFTVELKALRNGHQVDERIYPELQQMFDDARKAGIYPLINESFRTAERQQQIMDKYIRQYEAGGLSHDAAVAKALTVVAVPGTSEHQLGLALDIIAEYDSDNTATWNWLRDNCWRYGFILRYPKGKEKITGIDYEPWHFRYVGVPTAQEITESGLCLEEYLAQRP